MGSSGWTVEESLGSELVAYVMTADVWFQTFRVEMNGAATIIKHVLGIGLSGQNCANREGEGVRTPRAG